MIFRHSLSVSTGCLLFSLALSPTWGSTGTLGAQGLATVTVEENIRAEPRGVVLGRLLPGTALPVLVLEDQWVEVRMEGWVWAPSVQATDRMGFDLQISASPEENLRAEPAGDILGRLSEGTLLTRLGAGPNWFRVSRDVWLWRESVSLDSAAQPEGAGLGDEAQVPEGDSDWWVVGTQGAALLSVPDGDTLAQAAPETGLRVLAREGSWVRVRMEGWVWAPEGETVEESTAPILEDVEPSDVVSDPDGYRGRTFSWELQYVSLERAEKIRTDFYEGEPFLLTRAPNSPGLFVYVAVPPERVSEVEGLIPLQRIRVVGRLRTGAATLTGNPILDLLELTRIRR